MFPGAHSVRLELEASKHHKPECVPCQKRHLAVFRLAVRRYRYRYSYGHKRMGIVQAIRTGT